MDDHTEGLIKARSMTHPEENGNGLPPRLIEKIFSEFDLDCWNPTGSKCKNHSMQRYLSLGAYVPETCIHQYH